MDTIRRWLAFVLCLGIAGTATDLLLLDHLESWTQLIPLFALGLAALTLLWNSLGGGASAIRALQVVMVFTILIGGLGMFLHYRGNAEFQTEIDPSIEGAALFWKVVRAKAPPAIAPAAMVQLGLIGLAYAFRHPSLDSKPVRSETQEP